jgi:hypothetical protein
VKLQRTENLLVLSSVLCAQGGGLSWGCSVQDAVLRCLVAVGEQVFGWWLSTWSKLSFTVNVAFPPLPGWFYFKVWQFVLKLSPSLILMAGNVSPFPYFYPQSKLRRLQGNHTRHLHYKCNSQTVTDLYTSIILKSWVMTSHCSGTTSWHL